MKRSRAGGPVRAPDSAAPRGGLQQRLARATATESQARPSGSSASFLATMLIEAWSWGEMSTPLIQRIADSAKKDMLANGGMVPPDLDKIATLGNSGMQPGHTHRDLVKRLVEPVFKTAISPITTWTKLTWNNVCPISQFILLPHILFAQIYEQGEHVLKELMLGGDEERLGRLWDQMSGTSHFEAHPVKDRLDYRERCIPLGFHGDVVAVLGCCRSWQKTCDAWSWSSLLCTEATKVSNYLIWLCFHHNRSKIVGKETLSNFWKHLR